MKTVNKIKFDDLNPQVSKESVNLKNNKAN